MPVFLQLMIMGLIAIALIAGLATWLYPQSAPRKLDRAEFDQAFAEHELDARPDEILLAGNGRAAIATIHNDDHLAVLRRMGDGYSVRLFAVRDLHLHGSQLGFADFTWPSIQLSRIDAEQLGKWLNTREQAHAA